MTARKILDNHSGQGHVRCDGDRIDARLRLALEAGWLGTWEWDVATNRVHWSTTLEMIHGIPPGTFEGTFAAYLKDIHPNDREYVLQNITEALDKGRDHKIEYRIIRPDGSVRWVEGRGTVSRDEHGAPVGMIGVCSDITERKERDQKFRQVADAAPVMIWVSGTDMLCSWLNKPWLDFVGRSIDQELGNGWSENVHPEDIDRCLETYRRAFDARERFTLQFRLRRYDGAYRWILTSGSPLAGADGGFAGYMGSCIDIDEYKRVEHALDVRARQQQAVAMLGDQALRERTLQKLLDYATATIAQTLGIEYCKILEVLPESRELLLRAGVGWKDGLIGRATVSADLDSQAGYTLVADTPVTVADLRKEQRFKGPPLLFEHGVVSGMSCIIRRPDGVPWGVLGAHTTRSVIFTEDDVTFLIGIANILGGAIQRDQIEAALRESEAQLRHLAETIPQLAWYAEPDGYISWYNQRWYDYTGSTPEQMVGWGWQSVHDPTVLPDVLKLWKASIASGKPFEMIFPLRSATGIFRPFLTRVMPLCDKAGRVVQWFGTNTDVGDLQVAQAALRESEQRFARFMQHLPGLAWIKDLEGRYAYANDAAQSVFGAAVDELYGRTDEELFPPATAREFRENDAKALASKTGIQVVETMQQEDGVLHHSLVTKFPISSQGGHTAFIGGIAIDITELKAAEERQKLLIDELNHRVKNTLAIIQSIASQTLRSTPGPEAFNAAFSERVAALARAHSLLTRELWRGASLQAIVLATLSPFSQRAEALRVEGPKIVMKPNAAVTLCLMLHEMATNAAKYGALSVPNGWVSLTWREAESEICLDWSEHAGPIVEPPTRRGFGSKLIVASADQLGGHVGLDYKPNGFEARFCFPTAPWTIINKA